MTSDTGQSAPAGTGTPGNAGGARGRGWTEATQGARWTLAILLALGALGVFSYWLAAGQHLACQVVTVTGTASSGGAASGTAGGAVTTTRTCGLPDVADFVYVLAAIAVLLLPDAQRLQIGGFQFERLSTRVEEQTREISQLRQTISTTINIGSDLVNQARTGFVETKDVLDRVRAFLPGTPEIIQQLATIDDLARRIDAESWPDLFVGIMTMHSLIELAGRETATALVRDSEAADTVEEEEQAVEAESVLSDYLGNSGTAGDDPGRP